MVAWDQLVARRLARLLARTPLHPNHVTGFSLVMGLVAFGLYALGDPRLDDWGALAFMLAIFVDHADGELARLTGRTSSFGHHFDHFAAVTCYTTLFVGMGLGLSHGSLGAAAIAMGLAAGVAVGLIFGVRLGMERRHGKESVKQRVWMGFEVEDTMYVVGPVTWLGLTEPFLALAAVGAPAFVIYTLVRSRRAALGRVSQD